MEHRSAPSQEHQCRENNASAIGLHSLAIQD